MEKIKFLYRAWRYRYKLDVAEINFLLKNINKGETCADVGCHKGAYLHWMRKAVGKEGTVYAFEPQKSLFEYLNKANEKFHWNNVLLENKGVSDEIAQKEFFIPSTKSGTSPGASLNRVGEQEFEKIVIETISLDDYFLAKEIFPSFIKIDVEGHEKAVLKGGINLLKATQPKILMECEQRHLQGTTLKETFEILFQMGYKGYFFAKKNLVPISEFAPTIHQNNSGERFWEQKGYVNNFVFV